MAGPRIYDVDSPWYTRPQYYTVATPLFGFNEQGDKTTKNFQASGDSAFQVGSGAMIHPSRVIEFAGAELPDWRLIPMGGGWGDSVLQTVDETLKDIGLIVGGMANMVNDAKMDVIKIPNFSQNIATTEYANRLLARFAYANQSKSTVNSILLDKEEEWQRIQSNFGGLPNLLHEFFTVVAGAADMPLGRLMSSSSGRAMSGGGAATGGGEADLRGYYDRITSKQKTDYSPRMAPLDEVLVRSATGTYDNSIYYDWNPLWQITDAEKAKIALDKVSAMKIEIEMGLLNEDALRKAWANQLIEDGTYAGLEDAIDEFGEEPEEPDIQTMWSRLAGAMPPQVNGPPEPKQLGAPAPDEVTKDAGEGKPPKKPKRK
jgi:phage-related protein (TIGR01555 family)